MRSIRVTLALMCLTNATWAAEPTAGKAQVSQPMSEVLKAEAAGQPVNRRTRIEADTEQSADRWQAGELLIDGSWTPLERISYLEKPRQLKEYESLRNSSELSAEHHRKLAHWCKLHRLPEQARAHWYGVLLSQPEDIEARRGLGHQAIGGRWYTPEELRKADELSQRTEAEWRKWMPVMRKLASDIGSSNTRLKQQALERLAAIEDPSAISALEVTAHQLAADQAVPFVQAIARQRSSEACLALTRISFAYPVDVRGDYAIGALKEYPKELYVPELLDVLSTPIESQTQSLFNSKGELLIRRAMFREVKDEKQEMRLNQLMRVTPISSGIDIEFSVSQKYVKAVPSGTGRGGVRAAGAVTLDTPEDQIAAAKNALEDQRQFDSKLSSANAELARSARSAYVVLEKSTGESVERTPQAWWNWWRKYNERTSLGKSTRRYEFSKLEQPRAYTQTMHVRVTQMSCLVAGTLVHTADGPKAIEKIRVGDRVVSQDVETGELALKPVLQTTVRPPKTTLTIVTDKGKIQATAGHRWFVAGKGWVMTRDLEPGMLLHDATGTTRIAEVTEDPKEQETYNLVVDGFHTYFVGSEQVLSFDNSDPIPTLRAVPGFGQVAQHEPLRAGS